MGPQEGRDIVFLLWDPCTCCWEHLLHMRDTGGTVSTAAACVPQDKRNREKRSVLSRIGLFTSAGYGRLLEGVAPPRSGMGSGGGIRVASHVLQRHVCSRTVTEGHGESGAYDQPEGAKSCRFSTETSGCKRVAADSRGRRNFSSITRRGPNERTCEERKRGAT